MAEYRALTRLSLWKTAGQRPDPFDDPAQWLVWEEGEVFTPPAHFEVETAFARGIIASVGPEATPRARARR